MEFTSRIERHYHHIIVQKEAQDWRSGRVVPTVRLRSLDNDKDSGEKFDGTYTEMLRMVLGVSWKDEVSNDVLYGKLPKLSGQRIRNRR